MSRDPHMPGLAHVAIAFGLSAVLHAMTRGKFTSKHAIIFSFNNLLGPDLFGLISGDWYAFFHGMGWLLAAIPLALLWSVFARYSLRWRPFRVAKRDPATEPVITFPEVFCLVAAGGLFHLFVDIIGHPPYIATGDGGIVPWGAVWFGGDAWFSIESIWATGMFPCGNTFDFHEFMPYVAPVAGVSIILVFFVMQRGRKWIFLSTACIALVTVVPLAIAWFVPDGSGFDVTAPGVTFFGDPGAVTSTYRLSGGEADLGVLVFFGLFFLLPMVLLWMGCHGIPGVPLAGYRAVQARVDAEKETWARERARELLAGNET